MFSIRSWFVSSVILFWANFPFTVDTVTVIRTRTSPMVTVTNWLTH